MKQSLHHCFQSFGVKNIKIFSAKCFFTENAKTLKSKLYTGINLESFHTQNQIFTKITGWHMEDMEDLASAHYSAWLRKRQASAWTTMFLALLMCVPTFSLNCENPHVGRPVLLSTWTALCLLYKDTPENMHSIAPFHSKEHFFNTLLSILY